MDFLPVLVVSNTEQHAVLSVRRSALNPRVSNSLIKHALVFNSSALHPTKPFRDDCGLAVTAREASTSDSYILRYYPLTEQQFGSSSLTPLSRWMYKSATTFGSTPAVVRWLLP